MNEKSILTPMQVDQFDRDGFLFVKGMYSGEEICQISSWTNELASSAEEPDHIMMYFESSHQDQSRILSRIENFVPHHAGFCQLITGRRMLQAVSELLREPAVLFKDKINFKLPGGDGFKEHQDAQAGWGEYADLHITAMVAIDSTNEQNGSLELLAGYHRSGLLGKLWEPLTGADTGTSNYTPVHCQPGDTVFFDSYTPHRSGPNRSNTARRVLYITYNKVSAGDSRARYYSDKRRNYPPDIERDPDREYRFKV